MTAASARTVGVTPRNPAEALVWYALTWTWPFYAIGALYVVGPVLAWILGGLAALSLYLGPAIRPDLRATGPIPGIVWLWGLGMIAVLVALWVGHVDWGYGLTSTIKSSIGWAKGWALIVLFMLAGAVLPIRRAVLVRAQSVLGVWTLCMAVLLVLGYFAGLPERLFVSPFRMIGGPGPEYFGVYVFTFDPASWTPRWQFFAPWSPFAAILGVIMILFALEEDHRGLRAAAIGAGLAMVLLSKSRMGLVGVVVCPLAPRLLPLILRPWAVTLAAAVAASMAVLGTTVLYWAESAVTTFKEARADSTRVREALQRIAADRWENDAFWWGHATVQPGPHLVEYMPIGTHHTWWGLLFVKGVVGFVGFLVPFVVHGLHVLADAVQNRRARLPLGLYLTLTMMTFGENIEIQVYLLWPGLVTLGVHLREMAGENASGAAAPTGTVVA